jgi:chromosome segregation ATPase
MLQDVPLPLANWRAIVFYLVAAVLGSSLTTALVTGWLARRQRRAEITQADASTTEIRVRTRVAEGDAVIRYTQSLVEAQDRVDALRDKLANTEDKLVDIESRCMELTSENRNLQADLQQAQITIRLNEQFIARLHAATKLGVELKDLPPTIADVIMMLQELEAEKST